MDHDKLVLRDGTEIILESSQGIGALYVNAKNRSAACALWECFTKDNLVEVTVKNSAGETTGVYKDMVLDHVTGTDSKDGTVKIMFSLRGKSEQEILEERIAALEESQQVQDAGIGDLGQAISDMMEGGVQ